MRVYCNSVSCVIPINPPTQTCPKMAYIKLIIALVCPIIMVASAQIDSMDLESRIIAKFMHLEQKNSELENELKATKLEMNRKISAIQSERMYGTKNSFDCHLNDDYSTNGVIRFDGCSGTYQKIIIYAQF